MNFMSTNLKIKDMIGQLILSLDVIMILVPF